MSYRNYDVDYDTLFDTLVELNWLLASICYNARIARCELVLLIESSGLTRRWTMKALEDLWLSAEMARNRYMKFEEAASLKCRMLPGLYVDKEVQLMLQDGYSRDDFLNISKECDERNIEFRALYYALTATAALSEEYRRTL